MAAAGPIGKVGIKAIKQQETNKVAQKEGPSKFDRRMSMVDKQGGAATTGVPPEVNQISADQKRVLESNLRKRMENAQGPADVFKVDLRKTRTRLDGLTQQVTAVPKSPTSDAIRNRLTSIEGQYEAASKAIKGLNGATSPQEMLQLQMQMYRMTQNIELMSKFVEQTTGGVKSILQTQV